MKLTKHQQKIFDHIESSNQNFLILGKPGVGKSVLINALINEGKKDYSVSAPTGLAAININGKTLHSLFKIPIIENGIIPAEMQLPEKKHLMHLVYVKYLIIDEISMVRADILDYIDRVLRYFRGKDDQDHPEPFGGIQIIMVGDFCQLAPVVNAIAKKELKQYGYRSEFAFDAKCFDLESFVIYELVEVLRQKDDLHFMSILNDIRFGNATDSIINDFNSLIGTPRPLALTLTATNREADLINDNEMNRLRTPSRTFSANVDGEWPEALYPLPAFITLKEGAQVMVRKNNADRNPDLDEMQSTTLVNGDILKVAAIEAKSIRGENAKRVYIQTFNRSRKVQNPETKKWKMEIYASFTQLPLTPAWAISMHKSQGQSYEFVNIDPSRIFTAGQLYVALSRARSMNGITLMSPVTKSKFTVNNHVKNFYESIG